MKSKKGSKGKQVNWVFRGSIVRHRRKCGQEKCYCNNGALHETWVLSVNVEGRTQLITLLDEDLPAVRAGLNLYYKQREDLEKRVQESMRLLRKWRQRSRTMSR